MEGILTARDMSDFGLSAKVRKSARSEIDDFCVRVWLSSHISLTSVIPLSQDKGGKEAYLKR